jgi:hypothetical protein
MPRGANRNTVMRRLLRSAAIFSILSTAVVPAFAQAPQLVFTTAAPERTPSESVPQLSVPVEERGLRLWAGAASDFGVAVALSDAQWTVRSITSMVALPVNGHQRPTFQQIEVLRPSFSMGPVSVAGGGGIRQEWDGTRVLIGRVMAGAEVGGGWLQGSVVVERAGSSPLRHDTADLVTSFGWSRRLGRHIDAGLEAVGQDVEGLWNTAESDGGAKLVAGPSLHVHSTRGKWAASLTGGPVVRTPSTSPSPDLLAAPHGAAGRHFGFFASASWTPALTH